MCCIKLLEVIILLITEVTAFDWGIKEKEIVVKGLERMIYTRDQAGGWRKAIKDSLNKSCNKGFLKQRHNFLTWRKHLPWALKELQF